MPMASKARKISGGDEAAMSFREARGAFLRRLRDVSNAGMTVVSRHFHQRPTAVFAVAESDWDRAGKSFLEIENRGDAILCIGKGKDFYLVVVTWSSFDAESVTELNRGPWLRVVL